jgi:hypothetical protein
MMLRLFTLLVVALHVGAPFVSGRSSPSDMAIFKRNADLDNPVSVALWIFWAIWMVYPIFVGIYVTIIRTTYDHT